MCTCIGLWSVILRINTQLSVNNHTQTNLVITIPVRWTYSALLAVRLLLLLLLLMMMMMLEAIY